MNATVNSSTTVGQWGARMGVLVAVVATAVLAASCRGAASDVNVSTGAGNTGSQRQVSSLGVTLPVGTVLHLQLRTAAASDSSSVEDVVTADVTQPVVVNGRDIVPVGATVSGLVSEVEDSGRVKGRAQLALRFTSLRYGGTRYDMETSGFSRTAPATKGEDAAKIGVGAGVGAAVGAILGGKKGAAEGAAIGGGAGTGVVLATKGQEVRFASGTDVSTRLTAPLTVRVRN